MNIVAIPSVIINTYEYSWQLSTCTTCTTIDNYTCRTITPDQSRLISHSWSITPDQSLLISHAWSITPDQSRLINHAWSVTPDQSTSTYLWWLIRRIGAPDQSRLISYSWSVTVHVLLINHPCYGAPDQRKMLRLISHAWSAIKTCAWSAILMAVQCCSYADQVHEFTLNLG